MSKTEPLGMLARLRAGVVSQALAMRAIDSEVFYNPQPHDAIQEPNLFVRNVLIEQSDSSGSWTVAARPHSATFGLSADEYEPIVQT